MIWINKIYLSLNIFSNLPYVIINHYFGVENLKLYGQIIDKVLIFTTGTLIAELLVKLSKNKTNQYNFCQAVLCFSFFIINPWTYKMLIAQWITIYFVLFYLIGIFLFLNKKQNLGLPIFFISGMFDYQSSSGIAIFYIMLLIIFLLKRKKNAIKSYVPNINNHKFLNYKIIISLILPAFIYFFLRLVAENEIQTTSGSSILNRIGISGNDIHNGSLLGALQFIGGNRITQCFGGFSMNLDLNNLPKSIFAYNCILSHLSMFLVSLISIVGIFIFYKNYDLFFRLTTFSIFFFVDCSFKTNRYPI
jgi:hypothetical protein